MALKRIVYLKKKDYNTLKDTGTVIVDGKTITYSEDDDYRVPDETQEQIADLQAEQVVQSAKITAVEESVKKYYRHKIEIVDGISFSYVNNSSVKFTNLLDLLREMNEKGIYLFPVSVYYYEYDNKPLCGTGQFQFYSDTEDGDLSGVFADVTTGEIVALTEEYVGDLSTKEFNDDVTEL